MSTIISIDTSSDIASVALLHKGEIKSKSHEGFSSHSTVVLPMLHELLDEAGLTPSQCDAIAFGCGPGSFTGIRTACGIVQGISFGLELPVIQITTLEAMAEACRRRTGVNNIIPILDARMHEIYWAEYLYQDDEWKVIVEPQLSSVSDITTSANAVYCGNGLLAYGKNFPDTVKHATQYPDIIPHAESIALLAENQFIKGNTISAEKISPLYLRNKVALKTAERLTMKEQNHG